jgi:hypothetical protein
MDEESENPTMEKQLEVQYWFPNNGAPSSSNCVFNSQSELLISYLKTKYILVLTFPLHFLCGLRGVEEDRLTHVSIKECLKHYHKISLPMFQHSDIILIISPMYFRNEKAGNMEWRETEAL